MSKQLIISQLIEGCDELFENFQCQVSHAMERQKDEKLQEMHIMARNLSFTISVIDMNLQMIIFQETNHPDWIRADSINTDDQENLNGAMAYTHPDDVVLMHRINLFILKKLKKMPLQMLEDFEISFFRRMKNPNGEYYFCLQRISVLLCNDDGKPWLLKSITTHPILTEELIKEQIRLFKMEPQELFRRKRKLNKEEPVELTPLNIKYCCYMLMESQARI